MSNTIETMFLARRSPATASSGPEFNGISKLWGFILCVCMTAGFIALSLILWTHNSSDPGFSRFTSEQEVSNIFGTAGAWISDLIYLLFGWGVWIFAAGALFFLIRGIKRIRGRSVTTTIYPMGFRIFAFVLLLLSACALFFLRFHSYSGELPGTTGGVLGSAIGSDMLYWMNHTVATVLLLIIALYSASVFLGFSWIGLCEGIGRVLENIGSRIMAIRQTKEDIAAGKASIEEREKMLQDNHAPHEQHVEPAIKEQEVVTESEIFGPKPEDKVVGIHEFEPIDFKPDPTFIARREPQAAPEAPQPPQAPQASPTAEETDDIPVEQSETVGLSGKMPEEAPFVETVHEYELPSANLLTEPPFEKTTVSQDELRLTSQRIEHILQNYKITAKVLSALPGPIITRFKVQPGVGVKSKKFVEVAKDLARGLGQPNVRVVENLREIDCIGLEVPNSGQSVQTIYLKEIINSLVFKQSTSPLTLALGKNVAGEPVVIDLAKAPHLLVAGTTGSGKSVGVNAMILSMLYKNNPDDLKLILIDPKEVEFGMYEDIPHLLTPVITDMSEAAHALNWCVREMDRRYKMLRMAGVRNFDAYNEKIAESAAQGITLMNKMVEPPVPLEKMPYIIIIVDEYSDLLMMYGKEVENKITRLTQKARAAGMHVILATQRPSTDVVTAVIKANCPSRISFQVSNRYDSMTILNTPGAEELLGRGDMFYMRPSKPLQRIHGAYVTDEEINNVTNYLRSQGTPCYVEGVTNAAEEEAVEEAESVSTGGAARGEDNALYDRAVDLVISENRPSISYIQRRLSIGYNRAANLIEQMEKEGIVSAPTQNGKRQVLAQKTPSFED
ncbi:DNA translocase FtsK [uncultured Parasutterella sp.]|uniref:DNA translocase FtsK n=1 Tax=uncultured Parasutterella sp. TaxID=1263098 RepID=UPI002594691C|nr:DNA translocase FtsK [uncultured Parasutterella sp.]